MRNTPLIQSIDPGIHFYDAERDINAYIPVDKDGNWKFPEQAPDVEIDGYKFFFKGYGAIELVYDQNHITALRTAIIKNVPFGSILNINDHDLRTQFNLTKDPPYITWGGIFAQYEAPAFQKFQFYSTNVVFWKQQEIDGELYNFYKIPCHRYHYLLQEPLSLQTPSDDLDPLFDINGYCCKMKLLNTALDLNSFTRGEGPNSFDGVTKIENNMTIEHDTFVISQTNPLKQNFDMHGLKWIIHESNSYNTRITPGLTGTLDSSDQLCVIACLHVSYDPFAKQSRSYDHESHVRIGYLQGLIVFDKNGQEKFSGGGTVPVSEAFFAQQNLLEVYRDDTEYIIFTNQDDPINGTQATVR